VGFVGIFELNRDRLNKRSLKRQLSGTGEVYAV